MNVHNRKSWGASIAALFLFASTSHAAEEPTKAAERSIMSPPLSRGMLRVQGTVRPFFNLAGPGGGALSDLSMDYYFQRPFKVGLEFSPVAFVGVPEGLGAIAHTRIRGAFAADWVEIGLGVGARLQHFGPNGWSVAPALRLGSIDGLNLRVEFSHSLIRNYYTGQTQFALAHILGSLAVPVSRKVAITLDGGYGNDLWVYATLGLKQVVTGNGGPGTLIVGASSGLVWIIDRFPCQYGDIAPCRGAAWGIGPTIAIHVDRRF